MTKRKMRVERVCENCGAAFEPMRDDARGCSKKCNATLRKRRSRMTNPNPQERFRMQALELFGSRCMHCSKGAAPGSVYVISPEGNFQDVVSALVLCRFHARIAQRDFAYARWTIQLRPRSNPVLKERYAYGRSIALEA